MLKYTNNIVESYIEEKLIDREQIFYLFHFVGKEKNTFLSYT